MAVFTTKTHMEYSGIVPGSLRERQDNIKMSHKVIFPTVVAASCDFRWGIEFAFES